MQNKTIDITSAAAHVLQTGGVIAYPTEAVFGLGCDPLNESAVLRILDIKQRPASKGLILIAATFEQLLPWITLLDDEHMQHVFSTWPGAITWLLPKAKTVPFWISGEHDTVAVRVTAHPVAAALCRAFGQPLVSTSANYSEQSPLRDYQAVANELGSQVDYIVPGKVGDKSRPSEIRDARTGEVVRAG